MAERRGIQSIEIGTRIMDVLRLADGPQPLKILAAGAGLPPSNCHRYLVSFMRCGYVVQDRHTGCYDLGPKVLLTGLAALSRIDAVGIAGELLEEAVNETGYSGQLAIWTDAGPTTIRWIPGRRGVRTSISVGSVLPILSTATGQIFLSYLPRRQTADLVEREKPGAGEEINAIITLVRGDAMVEEIGQGAQIPGLSVVAMPLLDVHGEVTTALTLVGNASGIDPEAVKILREKCRQGSHRLGHMTALAPD